MEIKISDKIKDLEGQRKVISQEIAELEERNISNNNLIADLKTKQEKINNLISKYELLPPMSDDESTNLVIQLTKELSNKLKDFEYCVSRHKWEDKYKQIIFLKKTIEDINLLNVRFSAEYI